LGKTVFHLIGLDSSGQVAVRKRRSRTQLLAFTGNLQVQLHISWGRLCERKGTRALDAGSAREAVFKTNKSDYIDAEAIAEAVQRPRMRFVPITNFLRECDQQTACTIFGPPTES